MNNPDKINKLMNLISGRQTNGYIVNYHIDQSDAVVIDYVGSIENGSSNVFIAFNGATRKPTNTELEKTLKIYLQNNEVKAFCLSGFYL